MSPAALEMLGLTLLGLGAAGALSTAGGARRGLLVMALGVLTLALPAALRLADPTLAALGALAVFFAASWGLLVRPGPSR